MNKITALFATLALAAVTTGCGDDSSKPIEASAPQAGSIASASAPQQLPSSSSSVEVVPLGMVAEIACGQTFEWVKPNNREMFTSDGATCPDGTQVWVFDGPGAVEGWASIAQEMGRVLVGTNWTVVPGDDDAVLERTQEKLGGEILGGF